MSNLRLAGIVNDSITDGPGIRLVVFVQGCPHKCIGCHNQHTHDFAGGYDQNSSEILEMIDNNPLLSGVTFSGGEPMCQAKALLDLAKEVKKRKLELAIYTGYLFEDLIRSSDEKVELLKLADILIDGPFIISKKSLSLKFKGSSNQRVIDIQKSLINNQVVLDETDRWN